MELVALVVFQDEPMTVYLILKDLKGDGESFMKITGIKQLREQLNDGVPVDMLLQFQVPAELEELLDRLARLLTFKNLVQVASKELLKIVLEFQGKLRRCCLSTVLGFDVLLELLNESESLLEEWAHFAFLLLVLL